MKTHLWLAGGLLIQCAGVASADFSVNALNADWTVNRAIPVGNPVGITVSETLQNLRPGPISSLAVRLNISGGYNGALVGYLEFQDVNGRVAMDWLLNQVGTSDTDPFGSDSAGFDTLTLSDRGTANGSIHNATGIPTGIWQPDSLRTLDGTFGGLAANGTYTLFLADLDAGTPTPTLISWGLDVNITPAPEPRQEWLLAGGLMVALVVTGQMRRRVARIPAASAAK